MSRPLSCSPFLRPGRKTYSATFTDASGKRVMRSLNTDNLALANVICTGIVSLRMLNIRSVADAPDTIPQEAVELFFGSYKPQQSTAVTVENLAVLAEAPPPLHEIEKVPDHVDTESINLNVAYLHRMIERQRQQINTLKRDLALKTDEYRKLETSILAQTIRAQREAPLLHEALTRFETNLRATTTRNTTVACVNLAKQFLAFLPSNITTTFDITSQHVSEFLDKRAEHAKPNKALSRRLNDRLRIGRFINWAADAAGYKSQMNDVRRVTTKSVLRERGEIVWHTLNEVEAAVKPLDDYWRTLVSVLAYAGLQLSELAWLRTSDIAIAKDGKSGTIFVTAVSDPTDTTIKHLLKTGNRQRQIDIEPTHLLPRLVHHLGCAAGDHYMFPVPGDMAKRTRTVTSGSDELWVVSTLSKTLVGQRRHKHQPRIPGLLPNGMSPRTLRHTFGSLLLRSRKPNGVPYSLSDVAAAMGNTPEMVRQHYARIISNEVQVRIG